MRPAKRKKVLIAVGCTAIAAIFALIGAYVVSLAPNTASYEEERSVFIPPDATLDASLDSLSSSGVVRRQFTMSLFARVTGWGDQIKAGHYTIAAGASNYDILDKLRKGLQTAVRVTIPPGSRPEVVAAVAARRMHFDADEFLAALTDTSLARAVGTDTTHMFGFMLPETYFFYWLTDARQVITTIKREFDRRYDEFAALSGSTPRLSREDAATVASIVEWETAIIDEKPRVAGVYLNRLRDGWRLQADPTVQYAILQREGSKRRLFFTDYRLQHPYNTYLFRGLPPGPVTNASPSSLRATLIPEQHKFFYFVARGDGGHIFSRTLAEHNRNADNYRRLMRQRRAAQSG